MARPKARDPRSEQLLLRLTRDEIKVLEAVAALRRMTTNAVAYEAITRLVETALRDPLVSEQMALHERQDQRSAEVVQLGDQSGARNKRPR